MKKLLPYLTRALMALGVAWTLTASAQDDAENFTSNNRGITVVPAPGPVVIDGKDNDWDLSAGILSYNDPTLVNKYGVWTHVMWDDKGIYLLLRYNDSSPMKNATRGQDFDKSWRADAFQGRVVLDEKSPEEHQMHINIFHSSDENKDYMIVHHGGLKQKPPYDATGEPRPDQKEKYGTTMEKFGGKVAFSPWENGKGYNLEAFWPWSYVRTNGQPLKAGDSFVLGVEAMWGNADGSGMEHRLVDNMRDDKVNRIFFFRAKDGWGKATLSDKGKLNITAAQKQLQEARLKQFVNYDTEGPVPISYTLPDDRDVTIAIDNEQGQRVRNLFGQFPRKAGANTDHWDGLDDAGNAVPAGNYKVSIVDHTPITSKFFNSVYNAGTPPWATVNGRRFWGSNHGNPTTAATRGDVTMIGFTGTEGSSGIIRIDETGKILWTDSTELLDLALTDKYVYMISRESYTNRCMVRRLKVADGTMALFENPERSTESKLPMPIKEMT
ncbi:MAG: FlgD immunoglobulin-like domain containing protein, partial [Candidatus Methylacidiphilales bacterium]|nr:FlgD immunoglobulin-like domain containing protein [Candidatus Methylacidiphilales bacterium]